MQHTGKEETFHFDSYHWFENTTALYVHVLNAWHLIMSTIERLQTRTLP